MTHVSHKQRTNSDNNRRGKLMQTVEYIRTTDNDGHFQHSSLGTSEGHTLDTATKRQLGIPTIPNCAGRWAIACVKLPDGYRLAMDEDKEGPKPSQCMYFSSVYHEWRTAEPSVICWDSLVVYAIPIDPDIDITVTVKVNGKPVAPSTLSAETWNGLHKGTV